VFGWFFKETGGYVPKESSGLTELDYYNKIEDFRETRGYSAGYVYVTKVVYKELRRSSGWLTTDKIPYPTYNALGMFCGVLVVLDDEGLPFDLM
jgi:hypothetical protein